MIFLFQTFFYEKSMVILQLLPVFSYDFNELLRDCDYDLLIIEEVQHLIIIIVFIFYSIKTSVKSAVKCT